MSDRIVARRGNGCAAMSVGESGLAAALTDGSVVAGAALRAAVRPERFGLGRISKPPDRSRVRVVTINMQYGRYDAG